MSLKEQIKDIYDKYGLSDLEFDTYQEFLGMPQATISEIAGVMEKDLDEIKPVAESLEAKNFLKKIPGIIERYIPVEPYLEMYVKASAVFRDEVNKIKDAVLTDQSSRFENLENIETNAVKSIDTAVDTQVGEFFKDSDDHDVDKKAVIDGARSRFDETSKALEASIQGTLFKGRDRYETTSKALEADLHKHTDDNYAKFETETNQRDTDANKVWDDNSTKFTTDNTTLNSELDGVTEAHNKQSKDLEANLHKVVDGLNTQLKEIAEGYKTKYDGGIQEQKSTLTSIIDDLLKDYNDRLSNLEVECKKDLDLHVDHHKEHAEGLKPKLEEILEKYMLRMKQVLDELKNTVSGLLGEHVSHVDKTTTELRDQLNNTVENRQNKLVSQVTTFEKNTVILIDNLRDISDKLSELGGVLANRGSAWKALFLGRHKIWQEQFEEIKERVSKISGSMKDDFENSTANYVKETEDTKAKLVKDITDITAKENSGLKGESDQLDNKQKEKIDAELEGLAGELSKETDDTLKHNIQHCQETTVKLKDSVEKSLHTHGEDYNVAVNKHRQIGLKHYDDCNANVVEMVDGWYGNMDRDHANAKKDVTAEVDTQIRDSNDHLKKTKDKNVDHSREFERNVKDVKAEQRRIFDEMLQQILDDFKDCKTNVSDKINTEISLIKNESQEMDEKQHADLDAQIALFTGECDGMEEKLHAMLEDQKAKYKNNATTLQTGLTKTIKDNIQNVKDAIADFTLNFMNSIDEADEIADTNEQKLTAIMNAAKNVKTLGDTATWHVFGTTALIEAIIDAMWRVKSTITIITPNVEPKILEYLSQVAYKKKSSRFLYTTNWDIATYGGIIEKMKVLGNIQFRNLKGTANDFYAVSRDSEEIVLCPKTKDEKNQIAIVSIEDGYARLFSSFIYPIFQANSRPL